MMALSQGRKGGERSFGVAPPPRCVLASRFDPLRPGVSLVINLGEVLPVQVRVYLGGGDTGVAKQLLHSPEVAGGLQHLAGEGMPEHVRMDWLAEIGFFRPAIEAQLYAALGQTSASSAQKRACPKFCV